MSWHKMTFPLLSDEPTQRAFTVTQMAMDIDQRNGKPEGFAVFQGWEFGEDDASTNIVLYFSPVAASLCAAALPLRPCEAPDRDALGFGLAYGNLQGSSSWDLLK